jgi:imidazole glycerol-phosphate synthase subunit HisF
VIPPRVIPVLLIRDRKLVKTKNFGDEKYLGDPINALKIFTEKEVDEIIVLDISCSSEGRKPDLSFLRDLASEAMMPLTYGGGVSDLDFVAEIFLAGFEKVSVQTAVSPPDVFLEQLVSIYGSQAVVGAVDARSDARGTYRHWIHSLGAYDSMPLGDYVNFLLDSGVGEIFFTDVDREGSRKGLNLELVGELSKTCPVPFIAHGGVGHLDDIAAGLEAGADSVGIGSFCLFQGPHEALLLSYPSTRELTRLSKSNSMKLGGKNQVEVEK